MHPCGHFKKRHIIEIAANDLALLEQSLQSINGYSAIKNTGSCIQLYFANGTAKPEDINQYCFNQGITLTHLQLKKKSLESKFLELTGN